MTNQEEKGQIGGAMTGRGYGQYFRLDEGRVIGRLDESGKLVLVADPATLTPDILGNYILDSLA